MSVIQWPMLVRRVRFLLSLKQCELAERLRVDQGTVSRWERGTYIPDIAVQKRLRDMLRELEPAIDRNFIEQTPAIVIISRIDCVGFISATSASAAAPYQLAPTEMRDRMVYDITSESIRGFMHELDANPAWRHGKISMWKALLRRLDGSWCSFTGSPRGNTGFFMCIGAAARAPMDYTEKDFQLTLTPFDELCY